MSEFVGLSLNIIEKVFHSDVITLRGNFCSAVLIEVRYTSSPLAFSSVTDGIQSRVLGRH